jgi:hypothetical protein
MRLQGPTGGIKAVYIFQLIQHYMYMASLFLTPALVEEKVATSSLGKTSTSIIPLLAEGCNFQLKQDLSLPHCIAGGKMQLLAYTRPLPPILHCWWKMQLYSYTRATPYTLYCWWSATHFSPYNLSLPHHTVGGRMQFSAHTT